MIAFFAEQINVTSEINVSYEPSQDFQLACCVQVLDVGTSSARPQKVKTQFREIVIGWELFEQTSDLFRSSRVLYKIYKMRLTETADLRVDASQILGDQATPDWFKRFHPKALLGKYCLLGLDASSDDSLMNGFTKVVVKPLTESFKTQKLPSPTSSIGLFMISEPDLDLLEKLPIHIQELIKNSIEFQSISHE